MYRDDINYLQKNEKELETLIHAVRTYSQDTGMEFGIEKCAILVMKSGKWHMTDENTWADTIKQVEMKDKIQKEYFRRIRKLLETKLSCRNHIKGINTWTVPLRYSGPFLKWTREELKQIDQRTRKLMTMHKALDPGDDVDRHVSRKREEEDLPSLKTALIHQYNDLKTT